jgi:putative hydrolase of the HAD superfamily
MDRISGRRATRPVVLFDLDETLVEEAAPAAAAFLATCEMARMRHGIAPDLLHRAVLQRARELWRAAPTIGYCQKLGIASWEALWSEFPGDAPQLARLRGWMPAYRCEAWSLALAERALHTTHRLGLVTNGPFDIQRAKLAASGLEPYFSAVTVSTEVGAGKPDPEIFSYALTQLGAAPTDAVMVGDSLERDVVAAQAAGIKVIWLNRSRQSRPAGIRPDAEVETLNEVIGLLDS